MNTQMHIGDSDKSKLNVQSIYSKNNGILNKVKKVYCGPKNQIYDADTEYDSTDISWEVLYTLPRSNTDADPSLGMTIDVDIPGTGLLVVALMSRDEVTINSEDSYPFHLISEIATDDNTNQRINVWAKQIRPNKKKTEHIILTQKSNVRFAPQIIFLHNANRLVTIDNWIRGSQAGAFSPSAKTNHPRLYLMSSIYSGHNGSWPSLQLLYLPSGLTFERSDSSTRFSLFFDNTITPYNGTVSFKADNTGYSNDINFVSLDIL